MAHDGSFQVHGVRSVLLDSEPWNETSPLTATKGHELFTALEDRVRSNFRRDHQILVDEGAFERTRRFINGAAKGGGHGPYKFTWPKPSRRDQRRVDTNIDRVMAFVPRPGD